jgi:hypothetical protein
MTLRLIGCLMWLCEAFILHDHEIYYWLTREAMGCNAWRKL